jgi:hypothetical protein
MMSLVLACQMQQVDPLLAVPDGEKVEASLSISHRKAIATGMIGLGSGSMLRAKRRRSGVIDLTGAKTALGFNTWATLTPRGAGSYYMEWWMVREYARNGRHPVAVWQKGNCITSSEGGGA